MMVSPAKAEIVSPFSLNSMVSAPTGSFIFIWLDYRNARRFGLDPRQSPPAPPGGPISSTDAEELRLAPGFHGRHFRCRCGRHVFFRNSLCLGCSAPLGYEPGVRRVAALDGGPDPGTWQVADAGPGSFRRCENFVSATGCNWMIASADPDPFCIACRLNRTIPDQADEENRRHWGAIETSKRRLVSQLLALWLPVKSKLHEDPERGIMFDFLCSPPGGPRVMTGH